MPASGSGSETGVNLIVGSVLGALATGSLLLGVLLVFFLRWRKSTRREKELERSNIDYFPFECSLHRLPPQRKQSLHHLNMEDNHDPFSTFDFTNIDLTRTPNLEPMEMRCSMVWHSSSCVGYCQLGPSGCDTQQ